MTPKASPSQRLAKASVLSAATRKPLLNASKPAMGRNHVGGAAGGRSRTEAMTTKTNMVAPAAQVATVNETSHGETNATKSLAQPKLSITFAPSFVPARASNMLSLDGLVVDRGDVDDHGRVVSSLNHRVNSEYSSPPHHLTGRRRAKAANGAMGRRLNSIRNSRCNDAFRLQNEAFARRNVFDVNDPRKGANSYADVTLVGKYDGPWTNLPEDFKITLLGYVHRHLEKKAGLQRRRPENFLCHGAFAWFTFTFATARTVDLRQSHHLRIYNPVILPCHAAAVSNLPRSFFGTDGYNENVNISGRCAQLVICTHLCERLDSIPST